ncbi:BTAD domain-containing putative transcriptional regulator [Defluviimonas salinarum]|uniref:Tetratricopeptide repeat protein n=1 Tax=Defluviimonas salinarum TaxID=2992147 RepID=A0ABT3J1T8_9RHOB|nr:BTAD domain-containing putative transcriptional regulator [Defluviimonas salinarum]MCW3781652.1 tetratricopeptide repeat protein [Defluviimonas salinarum]
MAEARLTLLGGFSLRDARGTTCEIPGAKPVGLLAVLALAPDGRLGHDQIAALLWSDRAAPQARDSLKHALADLRRRLAAAGLDALEVDRQSVRLDLNRIAVDAGEFKALAGAADPQAKSRALELYGGELLHGVSVRDPAFDDWLRQERATYATLAESTAALLLADAEAGADDAAVREAATRLLGLDPLREDAVRALMRLHAEAGERAAALRCLEELRERLAADLQIEPSSETEALGTAIRESRIAASVAPAGLPLPDRPSIAVLPFHTLQNDQDQAYFADGVVEDLINALSRYRWFFVINRNSSFAFRNSEMPIAEIGQKLGVRYVATGSLRRAGSRIRLSAALIEADTGIQLWGDHYDRDLTDIFVIQDELTRRIVGAIEPELLVGESRRALDRSAGQLAAYDCHMKGMWFHNRQQDAEDFAQALHWQRRAIELDPGLARAYMVLARALYARSLFGFSDDIARDRAELMAAAEKAVSLEEGDGYSHYAMSLACLMDERPVEALAAAERAADLNPNLALAQNALGWTRIANGRFAEALDPLETALRLSPRDPLTYLFLSRIGLAHYHLRDYGRALEFSRKAFALRRQPFIALVILASLGQLGSPEVEPVRQQLAALAPAGDRDYWRLLFVYSDPADEDHLRDGLRKAGLDAFPEPSQSRNAPSAQIRR